MYNRSGLLRNGKGLVFILTTILVVVPFLGSPTDLNSQSRTGEELYFCILHTNDMHSALIPHSPAVDYRMGEGNPAIGGFARLATAVNEIRESKSRQSEPVLLLDAGDLLGGGAFAWLTLNGSAPELTIIQEMGYDAVTIGNHEYDYSPDILAQYLLKAEYPEAHQETLVLASNTEAPPAHPLAARDLYRNTGTFELENGLKVGVFGIIGEDAILSMGDSGDVQFLDQHQTARQIVDQLEEQGADVIVAISHSGVEEDRGLAKKVPGIDIIVGGHGHTALHQPVLQGATIIVQAGSLGMYLGQLELAYDANTGNVRVRNEESNHPFLTPIDSSFACDPQIDTLVNQYTLDLNAYVQSVTGGEFDDIMSTVARSDFVLSNLPPFNETSLGNFVADAMRFVAQEFTGEKVDIAGQANGNIRSSISPGTMGYSAGNISFYEIIESTSVGRGLDDYPGCPIASVYLTGEEVRRVLEITILLQEFMGDSYFLHFSGLRYSYNPTNAVLLTVPFVNLPVPTTRAVTRAELYTGDGIQSRNSEEYIPLKRGDERLYHVVTNAYLLLFLPLVTEMLPQLEVAPKNADGEPVPLDRVDELIIRHADGRELKLWEAVVIYAAAQPHGEGGVPQVPDYYSSVSGRITKVWTFPLIGWALSTVVIIITAIIYLIVRK
ncbi:MAG: bifunctional metallophosphatase/5'-nucleotidase, partial [Chloroflexota bacterium]